MSYIRFFHGCTEFDAVDIFVGGMAVSRGLQFGDYTPHFLLSEGMTVIRVEENGQTRLQNHVIVPRNQAYTLMLVCRRGYPELLAIAEEGAGLTEGSGVRIAMFAGTEAATDDNKPILDMWHRYEEKEELLFSEVQPGDLTEYVQLESGEHMWQARNEAIGTLAMLPGQRAEEKKCYTLYVIGRMDPEEDDKPLCMRLLQDVNG